MTLTASGHVAGALAASAVRLASRVADPGRPSQAPAGPPAGPEKNLVPTPGTLESSELSSLQPARKNREAQTATRPRTHNFRIVMAHSYHWGAELTRCRAVRPEHPGSSV